MSSQASILTIALICLSLTLPMSSPAAERTETKPVAALGGGTIAAISEVVALRTTAESIRQYSRANKLQRAAAELRQQRNETLTADALQEEARQIRRLGHRSTLRALSAWAISAGALVGTVYLLTRDDPERNPAISENHLKRLASESLEAAPPTAPSPSQAAALK